MKELRIIISSKCCKICVLGTHESRIRIVNKAILVWHRGRSGRCGLKKCLFILCRVWFDGMEGHVIRICYPQGFVDCLWGERKDFAPHLERHLYALHFPFGRDNFTLQSGVKDPEDVRIEFYLKRDPVDVW